MTSTKTRQRALARAAGVGAVAGLAGVAAMTLSEKVEQTLTRRPASFVPARALLTLLGGAPSDADQPPGWNHAMHWSTGALLGALRGVWSATGLRGPLVSTWHTAVRLAFDQTVENVTGVGAPPASWPRQEKLVDVAHKTVYALVTGLVADRLIPPTQQSGRGRTSH